MGTNPVKLSNFPPHVVQYIGYTFYDTIISCMYGTSDKMCNQSNAVLFTHAEMLNCYTLKLNQDAFTEPGPENGLTVLLYIGN